MLAAASAPGQQIILPSTYVSYLSTFSGSQTGELPATLVPHLHSRKHRTEKPNGTHANLDQASLICY